MTNTAAIRNVGVIGVGRMGQPIVGHLARKGYSVQVHDVDPAKRTRDCGVRLEQAEVVRRIRRSLNPVRYQLDRYGK